MINLGTKAPEFSLPNTNPNFDADNVTLSEFESLSGVVIAFICNHCPFVGHIKSAFTEFAAEYQKKGLAVIAISSNDVSTYPNDGPDEMAQDAVRYGYGFPYLYDESQEVARAYEAACTPDLYLFDSNFELVYRGQFDDSRPGNGVPVTGKDLRAAADMLLASGSVSPDQKPSIGCNIKWRIDPV